MPEIVKQPPKPMVIEKKSTERRLPEEIITSISTDTSLSRTIADWRPILTKECQVYVIGEQYIAKRFDQVHYKYMGQEEAREILVDNLYAILLYKYFPKTTDDVLSRIDDVVKGIAKNIKSFLTKITLDTSSILGDGMQMKRVPNSAVAFANGIYDFVENKFITKYERIFIPAINNTIILYGEYIIQWCFNFEFEPLPIDINETSFTEFLQLMKDLDKDNKNYCYELFYNMTHDIDHKVNVKRMQHLSEVLGYTLIPQFLQYFVMLIGSGQNGKNSLFDGCFSARVVPKPVSNSIESIEKDRFITESLEHACHNIFLETVAKTYTDSNMLKALTGSMYQTVEGKGVGKYAGVINCKYIFAGNDQSKIKFSDSTIGFRRRINIFEIYYSWDSEHRFMHYGDYYRTDFSGDLHEIKDDVLNTIVYIYLGMYGIKSATQNFTKDFKFSFNEWTDAYSDVDLNMKDFFNNMLQPEEYFKFLNDTRYLDLEHLKSALYSEEPERLYASTGMKDQRVFNWDDMLKFLNGTSKQHITNEFGDDIEIDMPNYELYMKDHDLYISLIYLKAIMSRFGDTGKSQRDFNDMFKKIYPYAHIIPLSHREQYVKVRMIAGKVRFVDK